MMIYWEALTNLPFGITKGDTITKAERGKYKNHKGELVPYDPTVETSFFKEVKMEKIPFEKGDLVVIKKEEICRVHSDAKFSSINHKIPAWTPLKVVGGGITRYKKLYVIVEFDSRQYEIVESSLIKHEIYYFINSSGVVHSTFKGKDERADEYRKKSKNFYSSKDDANKSLDKILKTLIK